MDGFPLARPPATGQALPDGFSEAVDGGAVHRWTYEGTGVLSKGSRHALRVVHKPTHCTRYATRPDDDTTALALCCKVSGAKSSALAPCARR